MSRLPTLLAALVLAGVASAPAANAAEPGAAPTLTVGVFLPQASFATNADRSAWAERFAADLTAKANGAFTAKAQVLARREDAAAFLSRVDVLVTDGLFAVELNGEVVAHSTLGPAVGLYASDANNVGELRGKVVACADAGPTEILFYANTALGGELVPAGFFGEIRKLKDVTAALSAVKSQQVAAAFAPVGHPAAAGLRLVAEGGVYPVAVVLVVQKANVAPVREALLAGVLAAPGGALGSFVAGAGDALAKARSARGAPRVMTSPSFLTGGAAAKPVAPPVRLKTRGKVPAPEFSGTQLSRARLVDPDDATVATPAGVPTDSGTP